MKNLLTLILLFCFAPCFAQNIKISTAGQGWAENSVNTVVFRKNSLTTHGNTQFIAFYNDQGEVVVGKRKLNDSEWETQSTNLKGNAKDAHCSISIMTDGEGYLHISWGHHGDPLKYAISKAPLSLEFMPPQAMTHLNESNVTYPEFFKLANGNLIFMYRDGSSGRGNLALNIYDTASKTWKQLHSNLIDGEKQRNAYWQSFIDQQGTIHVSWVWRETPDVATNHDMCYARSKDGGLTWEKSNGEKYILPIQAKNAENAYKIPQKSELMNQTSMFADAKGRPYIATYWRNQDSDIPQYRIIYKLKNEWKSQNLGFRKTPFTLGGVGTKRVPISRPQVVGAYKNGAILIFRDEERDSKVSLAINKNLKKQKWVLKDVLNENVGSWEPSFDTELWKQKSILSIFVQKSNQADLEGITQTPSQPVRVLDYFPYK